MPQLQGWVRHGLEVSRFPDLWPFGGMSILPKAALACAGGPWVWSLGLFSPIFFSTSINKKKLIKEYCRLSASPHSLQVTPSRARPYLLREGRPIGAHLWDSGGQPSLRVNKPPLHCGVPSRRRPSLVASLHSEGPSHNCGRGTRFWSRWLACQFTSPEVGVIWFLADGWLG